MVHLHVAAVHMIFFLLTEEELHASYWNNKGSQALHDALNVQPNVHQAKNIILFLGDGESKKGDFLPIIMLNS